MDGSIIRDQYRILKLLGRGGFAKVYLAEDLHMKFSPHCVIKQLSPQATDPMTLKAARDLFDREARILYQLGHHDQIPRLLAHFEEHQQFYVVEEFVEGHDLDHEFSLGKLNDAQASQLLQDLLNILRFVHQNNVIHRDIKPSNVIRRKVDGKLVLIDFGAVKQIQTQVVAAGGQSVKTIAVGTPGYMPNEQQGGFPRFASDLYAVGMTVIHGMSGIPPHCLQHDAQTGEVVWQPYVQGSPVLLRVLATMVRSHLQDRYQTIDTVLRDLTIAAPPPPTIPQISPPSGGTIPTGKASKDNSMKLLLGIIPAAVFVSGLALYIVFQLLNGALFKSNNERANELYLQGSEQFNAAQYLEAVETFDEALKYRKDDPRIWQERGLALDFANNGMEKEASRSLQKAMDLDPDNVIYINQKGNALLNDNQLDQSLELYERALKIDPESSLSWSNKGLALFLKNQHQSALAALERSLELDSNNGFAWFNKGQTLAGLSRYEEALEAYSRSIQASNTSENVWLHRGIALFRLERYQDARYSFDASLQESPEDPVSWFWQGYALEKLKLCDQALVAVEKALTLSPDYADAKDARARLSDKNC